MRKDQPPTNRLRVWRAEHRLSQHEIAAHLGKSQTHYWKIENGFQAPTPDERAALAALFKCRVSDIFPKRKAA